MAIVTMRERGTKDWFKFRTTKNICLLFVTESGGHCSPFFFCDFYDSTCKSDMSYKKENISSIRELMCADGGRNLTPVFKGNMFPVMVKITAEEFKGVQGNEELMKDLAIKKLNSPL